MEQALRILHLEDDANDAELVRETLRQWRGDCNVEWVTSCARFIRALESGTFDVILSDYALPGFNGRDALEVATAMAPEVPFLYVSGTLGEEAAIEGVRNGATDYVLKQRLSRLVPAVERALNEAAERTRRRQTVALLHDEAKLLRAILDGLDMGILACDAHGKPAFANRALREILALDDRGPIGEGWMERLEPLPIRRALAGSHVPEIDLLLSVHCGGKRSVLASAQPIVDERGNRLGALVVVKDFAARQEAAAGPRLP